MFALQTLDGSIETPREENPPSFSVDNWGGPDRSGPIFGMFARNEKCVANNRRLADNKPLDIVAKAGDNQLELILRLLIGYFFFVAGEIRRVPRSPAGGAPNAIRRRMSRGPHRNRKLTAPLPI